MEWKKSYSVLTFWAVLSAIVIYVVTYNIIEWEAVRKNPFETLATITNIEKCSKSGRCIYYKYTYKGKEYKGRSRIDIYFSRWCKNKNDCIGLKFKIIVNKDNPEQKTVDWDRVFKDKNFVNYP